MTNLLLVDGKNGRAVLRIPPDVLRDSGRIFPERFL
jgi:hypothetical protein